MGTHLAPPTSECDSKHADEIVPGGERSVGDAKYAPAPNRERVIAAIKNTQHRLEIVERSPEGQLKARNVKHRLDTGNPQMEMLYWSIFVGQDTGARYRSQSIGRSPRYLTQIFNWPRRWRYELLNGMSRRSTSHDKQSQRVGCIVRSYDASAISGLTTSSRFKLSWNAQDVRAMCFREIHHTPQPNPPPG